MRWYLVGGIVYFLCNFCLVPDSLANVKDTMNQVLGRQDFFDTPLGNNEKVTNNLRRIKSAQTYFRMSAAVENGKDDCQQILDEQGLNPNDVVWQSQNPGGEIVDIKAQEACEICIVGNGNPEWK